MKAAKQRQMRLIANIDRNVPPRWGYVWHYLDCPTFNGVLALELRTRKLALVSCALWWFGGVHVSCACGSG